MFHQEVSSISNAKYYRAQKVDQISLLRELLEKQLATIGNCTFLSNIHAINTMRYLRQIASLQIKPIAAKAAAMTACESIPVHDWSV